MDRPGVAVAAAYAVRAMRRPAEPGRRRWPAAVRWPAAGYWTLAGALLALYGAWLGRSAG